MKAFTTRVNALLLMLGAVRPRGRSTGWMGLVGGYGGIGPAPVGTLRPLSEEVADEQRQVGAARGWLRFAIALGCCALVAVPFLSVQFPPVTDLPQHVAQIRLFWEALHDPSSPYRVQWLTPYGLAYVVVSAIWSLVSPENTGRLAALAIGLLWMGTGHLLAAARGRSPAAAIVASVLLFNHTLYWGFYSFVVGWPVFAGWLLLTSGRRAHRIGWGDALGLFAAAALLYFTHALWLAVGALWFLVSSVFNRVGFRRAALRLLSFSPVLVVAAIWYPRLAAHGFDSPTRWFFLPSSRLSFSWLVDAILGGLRGPAEYLVLVAMIGWVGLALYPHRREPPAAVDRELLLAAALLACLAFLLPDLRTNTIAFAKRWAPCAAVLLVLGTPVPRWKPAVQYLVAVGLLVAMVGGTTMAWVQFDRREYSGLAESLRALPERPRVIGLNLAPESELVKGRPFIQTFAYAQVLRGGELNFSFADFAPSPVVYRTRRKPTWTWGLEWSPGLVQRSDLDQFDYAIVNGDEATHKEFATHFGVAPVTHQGRWRLYRLRPS